MLDKSPMRYSNREISGSEISIDGVQTAAPDVIQQ
jgi:hypothetical protein